MSNIYNMTDTWNNGAVAFTAIQMNVTDTASLATSLLMDLQVGGASKFSVDKTGIIVSPAQLHWFGGGAGNLWPQLNGTAGSTQLDMTFRNSVALNTRNVATFQNLSNTGASAIRFADETGVEGAATGYSNTGSTAAFAGSAFLESFNPLSASFKAIRLIQSNNATNSVSAEISVSHEFWVASTPATSTGNVFGIRANSSSYCTNAGANSHLFVAEQLGDRMAMLVCQPASGGTALTSTDGMVRFHIEQTSSTAPVLTLRNDGSGDWLQGQEDSNTVGFAIKSNAGSPVIHLGQKTSSYPQIARVNTAIAIRRGDNTVGTFSDLPSAASGNEGAIASITDGSTATFGATVAGGGSNHVMVRSNGTNWTVMGA